MRRPCIQPVSYTHLDVYKRQDVQLQDLALPDGTLIVSIRRNGTYIVPLGDVKLEPGDELQVSCERGQMCIRDRT